MRRVSRHAPRHVRSFAIALASSLLLCSLANAREHISPESVKAAFLLNFALYVEWPKERAEGELVIAVLGDERIAAELPRIGAGRTPNNRSVRVVQVKSLNEIGAAHVLYVSPRAQMSLRQVGAAVKGKPILTVADTPRGLDQGAVVNFVTVDRRIRFEISLDAADRAGLQISSRLLGAALNVERGGVDTIATSGR